MDLLAAVISDPNVGLADVVETSDVGAPEPSVDQDVSYLV
jgi:hypothetical protein